MNNKILLELCKNRHKPARTGFECVSVFTNTILRAKILGTLCIIFLLLLYPYCKQRQ